MGEQTATDILEKLGAFSVSQISDALGFSHPVEAAIRPLDPMFKICGRAVTADAPLSAEVPRKDSRQEDAIAP